MGNTEILASLSTQAIRQTTKTNKKIIINTDPKTGGEPCKCSMKSKQLLSLIDKTPAMQLIVKTC